jgi:ATP-dependent DNA ligase
VTMPSPTFTSLPRVEPIVPTARPEPFNDPAWLFEPKYDGFRGMLYLRRKGCTLYSKRGNAMTRFRGLAEQLPQMTVECRRHLLKGAEDAKLVRHCAAHELAQVVT